MSHANNRSIDTQTETKVVAMIARGDSYSTIKENLELEGTTISTTAISDIKKRNTEALNQIQSAIVQAQTSQATRLLGKSRTIIERRLDKELNRAEDIDEYRQLWLNGEISYEEYRDEVLKYGDKAMSTAELTSLTKEMFHQSQIEQGKPTAISENPTQAKENLSTLLRAISQGDEAAMVRAIFPDA